MTETLIEFENLSLPFTITDDKRQLRLPKSQTRVNDPRQMRILTGAPSDTFVPTDVDDEADNFIFSFWVGDNKKMWEDLSQLHRHEKLRLLCNLAQLRKYLTTRLTFFLHPDNVVFDDNLLPLIIYRGVRDLIPPFEMSEQDLTKQLKCFSIALFSDEFSFEQLYNGGLENAQETEFARRVNETEDLEQLMGYLQESYQKERETAAKTLQMVPTKRFRLFKWLSVIMIVVSVLLAAPLVYFGFISLPHQDHLLDAHEAYLASDDGGVISALEDEKAEKLPQATKYILAHSYINGETLTAEGKEALMNNVTLKSDADYLLYWIYNGRGELETAMDKAKYLDDPRLIMYGLLKQIEKTKNNPDLDGSERDEKLKNLNQELDEYREEYHLTDEAEDNEPASDSEAADEKQDTEEDKHEDKDD